MAVYLPNGSLVAIASGYGSDLTVSAISNANPAVATSAAHGLANGDFIEVTSGWEKLTERITRVASSLTGTFAFEGIDSTLTSQYPAAGGAGTVREISGWTQLTQIINTSSSGGEQQFANYQFLSSNTEKSIPTNKTAARLVLTVADDPTLAGYQLAQVADADRNPRAVRITLPTGQILLYNAYVSIAVAPSLNSNEVMSTPITLALLSDPVRYAS